CLWRRATERHRRSVLCGTFLRVTPTDSRQHPALWSPDLPRRVAAPRSPGRLTTAAEYARVPREAHLLSKIASQLDDGLAGLEDARTGHRQRGCDNRDLDRKVTDRFAV